MPTPDNGSFVSRFLVKFVEIIAAGLATALSGYLIAHLSGAFSAPVPPPTAAVIQAPNAAQPVLPARAESNEKSVAPQQEANAPLVAQPGRTISPVKAEAARKHIENATNAADSGRQQGSLVARVRAALRNVDANRKEPIDPPAQTEITRVTIPVAQPPSVTDPAGVATLAPKSVDGVGLRSRPIQETPIEPNPLTAIDINSRPVAEPSPAPLPQKEETGVLSTLEQMLRNDPLAPTQEPPRPPMPVGQ
jgi:hypothetical protein